MITEKDLQDFISEHHNYFVRCVRSRRLDKFLNKYNLFFDANQEELVYSYIDTLTGKIFYSHNKLPKLYGEIKIEKLDSFEFRFLNKTKSRGSIFLKISYSLGCFYFQYDFLFNENSGVNFWFSERNTFNEQDLYYLFSYQRDNFQSILDIKSKIFGV